MLFLMAGGGTGGHVIPALAVARELRARGHEVFFVGTARGAEARLVPAAGFPLEQIVIGGLQGLGILKKVTSAFQLISATWHQRRAFRAKRPDAVFSMGGYVAGPPVLAALWAKIPVVVMEPNAMPGLTNRWIGKRVARALVSFPETRQWFAPGRSEVTGLPVREEFFHLPRKSAGIFTVLVTGGSQGSRTLNNAARAAWPLFRQAGLPVRLIQQTGPRMFDELASEFAATGLDGRVSAFLDDMPAAFAEADLVICRAGAGAVSELAAAAKPAVLIPFPFATDDHQLRNAQALEAAGAARLYRDREWTGQQMFDTISGFLQHREQLAEMAEKARALARPGAAQRAADVLEQIAAKAIDSPAISRNNTV